jgi:hypothetical protein
MRKLFLAIMSVSAVAVLLGGVAFAWTTTASGGYTTATGSLNVSLYNVAYTSNVLYPTGAPIEVVTGEIINNTPNNPGIAVRITDGNITGISAPECGVSDGGVAVTNGNPVAAGGNYGGGWAAYLKMWTGAPNSCEGGSISYTVNIDVTTN